MKKKIIIIIIVPILLILVIAGIFIFRPEKSSPPEIIYAWFPLHEAKDSRTLSSLLREFESLYPQYIVTEITVPYQDMLKDARTAHSGEKQVTPDLIVLAGVDLEEYTSYKKDPVPWTGSSWQLYFSKTAIEQAGISEQDLLLLDWPEFYALLKELKTRGYMPISLGAKFGWPWLAWLQHLSLIAGSNPSRTDLDTGVALWQDIEAAGLMQDDYRDIGWAASVINMAEGNGLFLLFNKSVYTPLKAEKKKDIGSVPFPGSVTGEGRHWQTGSFFYLCLPETGDEGKGALQLFEYLSSEGVTERFNRQASSVLFGPGTFPEDMLVVPSLSENVMSPEMVPYLDWLRNHEAP